MLINEVIIVLLPDCLCVSVVYLKGKDPTALDVVDFRTFHCVVVLYTELHDSELTLLLLSEVQRLIVISDHLELRDGTLIYLVRLITDLVFIDVPDTETTCV